MGRAGARHREGGYSRLWRKRESPPTIQIRGGGGVPNRGSLSEYGGGFEAKEFKSCGPRVFKQKRKGGLGRPIFPEPLPGRKEGKRKERGG